MKILFVINALGEGGTETSTAALLPLLRERGIDTTVAILGSRGDEGVEGRLRSQDFRIVELGAGLWPRRRQLRRLISELRPALVHSALFDANLVTRLATPLVTPVLTSLVNLSYGPERMRGAGALRRKLRVTQAVDALSGFRSNHFHAVSEAVAASASRSLLIPRSRMSVVPRGRPDLRAMIPTDSRQAVRRRLGISDADLVLLHVGRQEPQKDHGTLLAGIEPILHARPDVHLLLAGRAGTNSAAIEHAVAAFPDSGRVHVLGHRKDVAELLSASDLLVFPSRYEGMPGAVLEAMSMGLPVVASDIDPNREVLGDIDLVPVGDADRLRAEIEVLLDSPAARARVGDRNRARFEAAFTIDRSADGMARLYRRLVDRR